MFDSERPLGGKTERYAKHHRWTAEEQYAGSQRQTDRYDIIIILNNN